MYTLTVSCKETVKCAVVLNEGLCDRKVVCVLHVSET